MPASCLIIDKMHPSIIPMLEAIAIKADYKPDIAPSEVEAIIHKYEGLVIRSKMKIDAALLEKASRLRFIARAGAGLDLIDIAEVKKRNILLFNAPEGNRDALAEHTLGLVLALLNNFVKGTLEIVDGKWEREGNRGYELQGKIVALIGYGFMGQAVAERLGCFGCKIIACDAEDGKVTSPAEEVGTETVFEEADIVSYHVPLTEKTRGMVNTAYLNKFKKPIWIINTARGEVLVLKDLLQAIKEGKVQGAALDVLEKEKPGKRNAEEKALIAALFNTQKVLFTPHVAGWTFESYVRINEVLVKKIKEAPLF